MRSLSLRNIRLSMSAWATLAVVAAAALLATGCKSSKAETSTGLSYWPPGSPNAGGPSMGDRVVRGLVDGYGAPVPESAWRTAATGWLGVPHVEGGHSRRGIDCSGFTDEMYREVVGRGIARTATGQWLEGKPIDEANVRPGDLVFFTTTREKVSHVGLSLGGDEFAHASSGAGVKFSSLSEPYWRERFIGARRMSP